MTTPLNTPRRNSVPLISDESIAEIAAVSEANAPYCRIYTDDFGLPTVVTMQPFDEPDYDQTRFLSKDRFLTEMAAWSAAAAL